MPGRASLRRIEVVLPDGERLVFIRCTKLHPPGVLASRRALSLASCAAANVGNDDASPLGDFVCTRASRLLVTVLMNGLRLTLPSRRSATREGA